MISQVQLDDVPDAEAACARSSRTRPSCSRWPTPPCPTWCARRRRARPRGARPRRRHDRRALPRRLSRRDGRQPGQHGRRGRGRSPRRADARPGRPAHPVEPVRQALRARALLGADRRARRRTRQAGSAVRDGIVHASRFAELDPYRATTHNKGIMNGIDAVVIATGNDWRAVEAGAHAFAARIGQLSTAVHLAQGRRRQPRRRDRDAARARHRRRARSRAPGRGPRPQDRGREQRARAGHAGRVRGHRVEPRSAARARDRRHPARSHGAARAPGRGRRRRGGRRGRARRAHDSCAGARHPGRRHDCAGCVARSQVVAHGAAAAMVLAIQAV